MTRLPAALAVLLPFCVATAAPPTVRLLGSVDDGPPRAAWAYAKKGEVVTLHVQVLGSRLPAVSYRWYAIEPRALALDNTTPSFHFEQVPYRTRELEACRDQPRCEADVTPRWMPQVRGLEGLGTMAFQVRVTLKGGREVASPGADSIARGGLSQDVYRVAIRLEDSYRGYLTELLNTPYIFGSDGQEGRHQADLLVGSDCADLTVYAARRSGRAAKYVSTFTLAEQAPEVRRATASRSDGAFLDPKGRAIAVGGAAPGSVTPGDLLLFPGSRHVGVLWEDRSPVGVLDSGDLMFHTCWAPPTVEPVGRSSCASLPIRVLRFGPP